MNKIILVGRLTKDPELTKTNNGLNLCRFGIACNSKQKGDDGNYQADFFNCVAWREKAEVITKYCKKGSLLQLSGTMYSRSYQKQDGTNQLVWEINVEDLEFLSSSKNEEKSNQGSKTKDAVQQTFTPIDDDELPF